MLIKIDGNIQVENLRNYPTETVERLRTLLASGAEAMPDPRRKDYYDVSNCSHVFFIHISPVNGKVMLLAQWLKPGQKAPASEKARAAV